MPLLVCPTPKPSAAKIRATPYFNRSGVVLSPYIFDGNIKKMKIQVKNYNLDTISSILGGVGRWAYSAHGLGQVLAV